MDKTSLPLRSRTFYHHGFTLVELLSVILIISLLAAASVPAFRGMLGSSSVNQAAGDLSTLMEVARTYALANHTYARIAISQTTGSSGQPTLIILGLYSADGTESADMSVNTNWPVFNKPLIITGFVVNNALNGSQPSTTNDVLPSNSTIGSLSRNIPGLGTITFTSFIDYNPSGEAGITVNSPSRYIKLAIDQAPPKGGINPFIIHLSGINGTVIILRKENL